MARSVEEYISENQRQLRRIEGQSVTVGGESEVGEVLNLGETRITTEFRLRMWKRTLGNGLISGHPNQKHGSNRGEAGSGTPVWNLVESYQYDDEEAFNPRLTPEGQTAILKSMTADSDSTISQIAVGPNVSEIKPEDGVFSWTDGGGSDRVSKIGAKFDFDEIGEKDKVGALKIYTRSQNPFCEFDIPDIEVKDTEEFRVEIFIRFGSRSLDSTVLTSEGRRLAAETVRDENANRGIDKIVFGGESERFPEVSQTSLEDRITFTKANNQINNTILNVRGKLFTSQPPSQPVTIREASLEDNSGNMLFRNTFSSTEKDSTFSLEAVATFRVTQKGVDEVSLSDGGVTVNPEVEQGTTSPIEADMQIVEGLIGGLNTTGYGLPIIAGARRKRIEGGSVENSSTKPITPVTGVPPADPGIELVMSKVLLTQDNAIIIGKSSVAKAESSTLSAKETITATVY